MTEWLRPSFFIVGQITTCVSDEEVEVDPPALCFAPCSTVQHVICPQMEKLGHDRVVSTKFLHRRAV